MRGAAATTPQLLLPLVSPWWDKEEGEEEEAYTKEMQTSQQRIKKQAQLP
jgi:hypothetical protein